MTQIDDWNWIAQPHSQVSNIVEDKLTVFPLLYLNVSFNSRIYVPSQVGRGWLQKWFFSQTSGSSWLSLYPGSHWKVTVDPMDKSWLSRPPFTGIPGSMQEYVSNVTTRKICENVISIFVEYECTVLFCTYISRIGFDFYSKVFIVNAVCN